MRKAARKRFLGEQKLPIILDFWRLQPPIYLTIAETLFTANLLSCVVCHQRCSGTGLCPASLRWWLFWFIAA